MHDKYGSNQLQMFQLKIEILHHTVAHVHYPEIRKVVIKLTENQSYHKIPLAGYGGYKCRNYSVHCIIVLMNRKTLTA